jgi:hypothetical protein
VAEIHFLICFDTETKQWKSADEALGSWFRNGPVWDGKDHDEGKWRPLNYDDPVEMDLEYEATEQVSELLKKLNGSV